MTNRGFTRALAYNRRHALTAEGAEAAEALFLSEFVRSRRIQRVSLFQEHSHYLRCTKERRPFHLIKDRTRPGAVVHCLCALGGLRGEAF